MLEDYLLVIHLVTTDDPEISDLRNSYLKSEI